MIRYFASHPTAANLVMVAFIVAGLFAVHKAMALKVGRTIECGCCAHCVLSIGFLSRDQICPKAALK